MENEHAGLGCTGERQEPDFLHKGLMIAVRHAYKHATQTSATEIQNERILIWELPYKQMQKNKREMDENIERQEV